MPDRAEDGAREAPGLGAIFLAFLRLGCTSFGGGTAGWLYRDIVLQRRWLDDPTFLANLTVGQALPGSNGIKLTVLIGQHLHGYDLQLCDYLVGNVAQHFKHAWFIQRVEASHHAASSRLPQAEPGSEP